MTSTKKFASDTLIYGIVQLFYGLRGIIILPVFSRTLGTEWYGLFMQLIITVNLLVPFLSFRLETAVVRFLAGIKDSKRFKTYYYSATLFVTIVAVLVVIIINIFPGFSSQVIFGATQYQESVFFGSLYLFFSTLMVFLLNFFRIKSRIKILSLFKLVHIILEIAVIIFIVYSGDTINTVIGGMIVLQVLFILALALFIVRELGLPIVRVSKTAELLRYSIPLMPNGLMGWAINYADRFFIVQVLGLAAVGTYSAAYSFGMSLSLFIAPIGFVLFPIISEKWDEENFKEVREYFTKIIRYFVMFSFPAAVGLGSLAEPLFQILATQEFVAESHLVLWIGLGVVFYGLYQLNVYVFHLIHSTHYITAILGGGLIVNLFLNIMFIPKYGLTGAAIATFSTYVLLAVFTFIYGMRIIQFQFRIIESVKILISSAILWFLLSLVSIETIGHVFYAIIGGVLFYSLLLIIMRVLTIDEVKSLLSKVT